jgi:PAS domain S-box-containing protein
MSGKLINADERAHGHLLQEIDKLRLQLTSEKSKSEELEKRLKSRELKENDQNIAEQALRDSEERYRALFDSIDEGFCIIEVLFRDGTPVDYRFLETNRAFKGQTGLHEAVGKRVRELVPGHESYWFEMYGRIALTGLPERFISEARQLERWYDVYAFRIGKPDERKVAVLFNDITERKLTEGALRSSEARYRNLFMYSPDAIFINQADRVTLVNEACMRLFGAETAGDLIGKPFHDLFPPESHSRIRELRTRGEALFRLEEKIVRPDGEMVDAEVTAVPFPFAEADATHVIMRDITVRKRTEEALRASREHLTQSQQIAHLGSWELDIVQDRLTWSDEVYRIFDVPPQEFTATYEGFLERVHPEDRAAVHEAYSKSLEENRRSYEIEHRIVRKSTGEIRFVHEKCEHFRDPDGRIIRSVGMVHDITDRMRYEDALRDSEAYMNSIFRAAPTGIGVVADRIFTKVNDKLCAMTGYSRDELVGRSTRNIYPSEEEYERVGREIIAQTDTVGTGMVETVFKRKDGRLIHVVMSSTPIHSGNERLVFLFTAMDITDRKEAEQALRKSEQRYRSLFHSMEAFALMEPVVENGETIDFRYLEMNEEGARLRGLTPEDIPGRTVLELLPRIDRYWIKAYSHVVASGNPIQFERRNKRTGRWYRTYAYRPEKGQVASFIIDITDRKLAEEKLKELTTTLERKVAERTELAHLRAKQLQALAVELIEAEEKEKSRLSELLHEDLQQILASARMQLQAASASFSSDPILESVERLLEESIRKSRSLTHELSPAVLHHSDLVAALRWLAKRKKERFGLQVEFETSVGQLDVKAPIKIFLFRAVQELLFNVAKHAGVKTAIVDLSKTEDSIVITVSDKGRGFDPEILTFGTAKDGLGLLSLRERASYVGGRLVIESGPGQGSRFVLTVPLSLLEAGKPQQPECEGKLDDSSEAVTSGDMAGIRVLIADDHKVMRQGLIRIIEGKPDISVMGEAVNGREAVEFTRQLRPDVVVMDVSMPEMDGVEATRRIKADFPEVRVIGLSMFDDEHSSKAMREAGAESFVSKSASSSELLKAIYGMERTAGS